MKQTIVVPSQGQSSLALPSASPLVRPYSDANNEEDPPQVPLLDSPGPASFAIPPDMDDEGDPSHMPLLDGPGPVGSGIRPPPLSPRPDTDNEGNLPHAPSLDGPGSTSSGIPPPLAPSGPPPLLPGASVGGTNLPQATLPDLKFSQKNQRIIEQASLEDDIDDPEILEQLRNSPLTDTIPTTDVGLCASIELFEALSHCPEAVYAKVRRIWRKYSPELQILSHYQVKNRIKTLTGVIQTSYDMCPNGCVAYLGADADKQVCVECKLSRWDPIKLEKGDKVAAKTYSVLHLGPQLQALWRSPQTAQLMHYGFQETQRTLEEVEENGGVVRYRDVYQGSDYLSSYGLQKIAEDDPILNFSFDGAQLYRDKESDCWFFIWVNMGLPPGVRYQREYVIIAAIIPGPKCCPSCIEDFLMWSP